MIQRMRRRSVRKFFNKKILEQLVEGSNYDDVRQDLMAKARKFRDKTYEIVTDENFIISEESADDVSGKARALTYYVLEAEKRIIDLYKIEREWYQLGLSPIKTYKLLVFKERITDPDIEEDDSDKKPRSIISTHV